MPKTELATLLCVGNIATESRDQTNFQSQSLRKQQTNLESAPRREMQDAMKFVLHGVQVSEAPVPKTAPKFAPKVKKKVGGRVQSHQTHEGYIVKVANVASVVFEGENRTQHCWWDTQPYDDDLICIPYQHEVLRDPGHPDKHRFRGPGSMCSMFCLWAYLCEEQRKQYHLRDPRLETAMQLTKVAFRAMFDRDVVLKAAPDWRLLDIYGGPLSIAQFRKASYDKSYARLPNIVFEPAAIQFLQEGSV